MKNPIIIMFDPDDHYKTVIDLILSTWDLKLSGFASNLQGSKKLVNRIQKKGILPTIAIIEAHMGKSEFDGEKIAKKLRELLPNIKILGFSTYETATWANKEAIKSLRDTEKTITTALSQLTKLDYSLTNLTEKNMPKDTN